MDSSSPELPLLAGPNGPAQRRPFSLGLGPSRAFHVRDGWSSFAGCLPRTASWHTSLTVGLCYQAKRPSLRPRKLISILRIIQMSPNSMSIEKAMLGDSHR